MKVKILRTNQSIKTTEIEVVNNDHIAACTRLRKNDPTIAAVKFISIPNYTWIGNATKEHTSAIAKAEQSRIW